MSKRSASRWTKVELGFVDADETANFGTRHEFSAPDSLYQIQTLACISPSEGAEDDKENKPSDKSREESVDSNGCDEGLRVVAECNGKLLAVAVNADVSIFDVSFMFRFQFVTAFDSTVTGLCWLPDVDILAVGCSNGYFSFISASKESILYRKRLQSGSSKPLTSLTSSLIGRDCVVAATFADGKRCALFLPDYADALKALKTNNMQAFKQVIANIRMEACSADFGIQSAHLMSSWNSWLLLPTSPKRPPYIAPFGSETVEALLLASGEDSSARCIRASSNGRFLFLLGTSGQLSVWDAWTHLPIYRRMIANAIDMALLQTDRATYALTDIRLILLVANAGNDKNTGPTVEIRTLPSLDVVYSVVVNQGTTLIANTVDEEDGIVIVEPEKDELGCVDNLRIRTVVEAQPDMKLIRLLNKCRFQQAELFAKQFGLDLQIVYKTQLNFLLDELQGPNAEQQHFDAFMKCLASVQDDDLVGDTCLAGGTLLTRFDWIAALLNYSDTRKSADADTLEQLTRLKYNLATFRLVFGAQASFDRDGRWFDFAAGLTWPDIVVDFIARGKLPEARLIWARYQLIIGRRLGEQEDGFQWVLKTIYSTVIGSRCSAMDVVELVEKDVMPSALLAGLDHSLCVEWLMQLAQYVETAEPTDFPENSLTIASIMVRIVEKLVGQSVTPKQQANAAYCCAVMRTDAETMDVPMGQLNRYITELRTLVKLKNDYDCRMSYAQFKKETTESICYRILDRVQAVEMLRSSVDKFARPYMTEHKLPADDTLYRYILDVAKNSIGTMTAGNPWEDRCLAIVDSITSTKLRCQSVIAVVKRAKLPWSRQLHTVVQRMLNECDSKELVDELRQQCRLAELKQLFSKYLVPSESLSKCLASSTKFDRLIAHMIAQEAIGSEKSRLDDALLAVELNPIASKMRVLISFGYRLVQTATQDNLSSLVAFVDSLEKAEGAAVATRLLQKIRERLDVPLGLEKSERIKLIEAALCLAQRFAGESVLIADDISAMAADLRSVRALQTKYDIMTSLAEFGHSTFKRQTLSDYINEGGRQKSWAEVIEFAATLLLSRLDTCEIAMKCAMGARNPHLMLQVLDDLLLNHGDHLLGDIVNMAINACRCSLEYLALLPDQGLNLVVELVQTLHKLLPKVIVICRKEQDLRFLLKLTAYVDFFMQMINQCLVDETAESGGDGVTEVRGIHRRLGDYRFSSDGALFDKEGAVRAVAMLAPSLLGNSATAEADWSTLLSLLSMHNQSMLEMSARLLKLAVFQLVARADFDELEPCVETLCEKIVLRSPADLNLAGGALLSLSLAQGRNAMNNLRRRVANGRKPRAMLSLVLLGQLTAGRAGDTAVIGMLKEAYAWNIWAKRLGKYCAQMPPGRNYISAVNQFARKKIPIDVLGEFCADFDLSLSDASLVYVLALLEQCREDADELESMRLADLALRSVRPSATVVEKLHQLLRSVDPYRYALIDFVLSKMSQLKTDEAVLPVPLTKLISLLHFLADYERIKKPMAEEVSWYAQKMKQSDCAETAEGIDSEPMDESTMDGLYEKPTTPCVNVSSVTLPTASNIRLPFHAFLPDNQTSNSDLLWSIVSAEISIDSVELWQRVAVEVSPVRLSQSQMLMEAVTKAAHADEVIKHVVDKIMDLLCSAKNRSVAIKCVAVIVKQLSLGKTKLRFVQLGIDVAEKWLKSNDSNMTKEDLELAEKYATMFKDAMCTFGTEFVLQSNGLLTNATAALVRSPARLVFHLYESLDWTDSRSRDETEQAIWKVAEINRLDLHKIQTSLLEKWLPPTGADAALIPFDLNETVGGPSMPAATFPQSSSDETVRILPYNDISLTKVVHLLRRQEMKQAAYLLVNTLNQDVNTLSGGQQTKIRALCCLMRLLKPEQTTVILSMSMEKLRDKLESLLYALQFELCRVDVKASAFESTNKLALAKSLWYNSDRQTVQSAHLVACLCVDYLLTDRPLVESLAHKLQASRKWPILQQLLLHCRTEVDLAAIKNLNLLWVRVFDWIVSNYDASNSRSTAPLRDAFLFLASCPTEGGGAFDSARLVLEKLGLAKISRLCYLLSGSTRSLPAAIDK